MTQNHPDFSLQEQWPHILNAWDPDLNEFTTNDYPPLFTDDPNPFDFLTENVETITALDFNNPNNSSVFDLPTELQSTDITNQTNKSAFKPENNNTSQYEVELLLQRVHNQTQKMNDNIDRIVKEQQEYRMEIERYKSDMDEIMLFCKQLRTFVKGVLPHINHHWEVKTPPPNIRKYSQRNRQSSLS